MPLINYNQPKQHICVGSHGFDFTFKPGVENEVPRDVYENLLEHSKGFKHLMACGHLKVVSLMPEESEEPSPNRTKTGLLRKIGDEGGSPDSLDDVDVSILAAWDATEFIDGVYSIDHLERFKGQEESRTRGNSKKKSPRKTVLAAINKQIGIMQTTGASGHDAPDEPE